MIADARDVLLTGAPRTILLEDFPPMDLTSRKGRRALLSGPFVAKVDYATGYLVPALHPFGRLSASLGCDWSLNGSL